MRVGHVDSKLREIQAALQAQPWLGARPDGQGAQPPGEPGTRPLPGAFLRDAFVQQLGVESYLRSAVDGLLELQPECATMWVPSAGADEGRALLA